MAATMVPKTSKKKRDDTFDRDAILERLFSLPLPPQTNGQNTGGRNYAIHTPLGRIMRLREVLVNDLARMDGCPNARLLCDYLAGRREITPAHRGALARALRVDARVF